MDVRQQAFRALGSATLFKQLRMIEFQEPFKNQRSLCTRQAQGVTIHRLRDVKLAPQQCLLSQSRQAHHTYRPELGTEVAQRIEKMCARSVHPPLQMQ
ncbi:hypothetical protein D3C84_841610 [compost metagenome]